MKFLNQVDYMDIHDDGTYIVVHTEYERFATPTPIVIECKGSFEVHDYITTALEGAIDEGENVWDYLRNCGEESIVIFELQGE